MKRIVIFKTRFDKNIFKEFKNSLLSFDEVSNKYYLNSLFTGVEEIIFKEKVLEFNNDLYLELIDLSLEAQSLASTLSVEPIWSERNPGSINGAIFSSVEKYQNCNISFSIIDFIGDLFIKFTGTHYLGNGNKRFAICFLVLICLKFGFYCFNSSSIKNYATVHETKMANFVQKLASKEKKEIREEIKQFIKNNMVIALKWR